MRSDSVEVSVCIPVYNGIPYLAEAIESVLAQTFKNYKLIILDDCSTDATPEIAQKYAQQDSRITCYRNEHNLGMARNWNWAILLARGEYIKLLCADDVIEPEHLQSFVNVLDTHPNVSLVTSFEQFIGDLRNVRKLPNLPAIGELDGKLVQKHLLSFGNWVGCPTAVMFRRRDLYMGLFNPDWGWVPDWDMWIRLLAIGNLYVVPRILSYSRVHNQQAAVVHKKSLTSINEELMILRVAFQFPKIYGSYTKSEQESLYCRRLNRLVDEGFGKKNLQSLLMMIQIGLGYGRTRFCKLFIKCLFGKIIRRIARMLKRLLPTIDRFSLRDLLWRREFGYKRDPKTITIEGGTVCTHGVIEVPINVLRAPIHTPTGIKLMSIEETPHFQWIKPLIEGNDSTCTSKVYREYLELFFPELDPDAEIDKMRSLVSSFQTESGKDGVISILTYQPIFEKSSDPYLVVYDGLCEVAIAKVLGHKIIQCRLVSERWMPPNNLDIL